MAMQTITRAGLSFGWRTMPDYDMRAPWIEHAGHGVVRVASSNGYRTDKRAGELAMGGWHYDVPASIAKAKAEGWGISEAEHLQLAEELGRVPTAKEVTRRAVELDYQRMKAWASDEWHWVTVMCTLLDVNGGRTAIYDTLSGIESDNPEYHEEVAHELAESILHGRGDPNALDAVTVGAVTWRVRP